MNNSNYDDLSLVSGGLIYRSTWFLRRNGNSKRNLQKIALLFVAITWVPIAFLSLYEGSFSNNSTDINFIEDFAFHVRFLLVVPFLVLIERVVDRSFIRYIKNSELVIYNDRRDDYKDLVKHLDVLTDSLIPEIVILIFIYSVMLISWDNLLILDSQRIFMSDTSSDSLSLAGWYYVIVCTPVLQLLVGRWLWRWLVWAYSVLQFTRMNIKTDPMHADQMAGLEYFNLVPLMFSFILMAPSAMLSAHIGIEIIYNEASFMDFVFDIAVYIFLLPIVLYSPLLMIVPSVVKAKIYGIEHFGKVIRQHNWDYANKWINHQENSNEENLLGTMDNSSLADINGSYAPIQSMRLIPINIGMIILSFLMNMVPYAPLVFTYYTPSEFLKLLVEQVLA